MKAAVIKTGGKQYVVEEGIKIKVDSLGGKAGDALKFKEVLLTATDKSISVGTPTVKGAAVAAEIIKHDRYKKIVGVKMKAKKRYRRYFGHKQAYSEVEIKNIEIGK